MKLELLKLIKLRGLAKKTLLRQSMPQIPSKPLTQMPLRSPESFQISCQTLIRKQQLDLLLMLFGLAKKTLLRQSMPQIPSKPLTQMPLRRPESFQITYENWIHFNHLYIYRILLNFSHQLMEDN